MKWFRENRFLGTFLVVFGVVLSGILWFVFSAKSAWDEAATRFANASTELNRLERLAPYPSEDNLRKMKVHAEDYSASLAKLQDELKLRVAPAPALAPNEFQTHLRLALNAVAEKARANHVELPDKFFLGFDDYVSALPIEPASPWLGQELTELEWLMNTVLEAHVDAVTTLHREPLPEEPSSVASGAHAGPTSTPPNKLFQRNVVELTFFSTPGASRKVINQIAVATQNFCIIRALHVRNEKEKGPSREAGAQTTAPANTPTRKASPAPVLNFIVGNEKVETTAKIEFVRFTL